MTRLDKVGEVPAGDTVTSSTDKSSFNGKTWEHLAACADEIRMIQGMNDSSFAKFLETKPENSREGLKNVRATVRTKEKDDLAIEPVKQDTGADTASPKMKDLLANMSLRVPVDFLSGQYKDFQAEFDAQENPSRRMRRTTSLAPKAIDGSQPTEIPKAVTIDGSEPTGINIDDLGTYLDGRLSLMNEEEKTERSDKQADMQARQVDRALSDPEKGLIRKIEEAVERNAVSIESIMKFLRRDTDKSIKTENIKENMNKHEYLRELYIKYVIHSFGASYDIPNKDLSTVKERIRSVIDYGHEKTVEGLWDLVKAQGDKARLISGTGYWSLGYWGLGGIYYYLSCVTRRNNRRLKKQGAQDYEIELQRANKLEITYSAKQLRKGRHGRELKHWTEISILKEDFIRKLKNIDYARKKVYGIMGELEVNRRNNKDHPDHAQRKTDIEIARFDFDHALSESYEELRDHKVEHQFVNQAREIDKKGTHPSDAWRQGAISSIGTVAGLIALGVALHSEYLAIKLDQSHTN